MCNFSEFRFRVFFPEWGIKQKHFFWNRFNPNPTGGGVFSTPPHGFLIAISLCYEKLSPNSLIFSFYMFATYFWKKISKW